MKTVLVTGCSSGFGREIARSFLDRGWTVVATMRRPRDDVLRPSERLRVLPLDVTDPASVQDAVHAAGPVDVLVNNAGIGWLNALEGTPPDALRELFETNVIGLMTLTQAVLPQMRERRMGVIVNVSSSVTLRSLPLLSVYTATKAAVNAFTESLALELEPFGVRTRLVLPGRAPETSFGDNARSRWEPASQTLRRPGAAGVRGMAGGRPRYAVPADVVEAVWRAATDPSCPMRLPAGADAVALAK